MADRSSNKKTPRNAIVGGRYARSAPHRWAAASALLACLAVSVACASAPSAAESESRLAALAPFAGSWSHDEAATAEAARTTAGGSQEDLAQRASDMWMTEMRDRGEAGNAVDGTPAGLRRTMVMLGVTPRTLTFGVLDDALSVVYEEDAPLALPAGGSWTDATAPQGSIEARLRWDGHRFAVERRISGGGTIRDNFSILESGHLLLTREIVWRRPQPVGLIVFRR
ncbi:MAG: hypothetical protein OXN18_05930 [Gemmatimonadota bacterium]|nr:hypothetical protein [Gemmatimonadota bacterium]